MDAALVSWMDPRQYHTHVEVVDQLPETRSKEREVAAQQHHQRTMNAGRPHNLADVSPLVMAACAQPASAAGEAHAAAEEARQQPAARGKHDCNTEGTAAVRS